MSICVASSATLSRNIELVPVIHAGKTTFLNVLAGKATYGETTGEVFYNTVKLEPKEVKKLAGFVPQDDLVHEVCAVGVYCALPNVHPQLDPCSR